MFGHLLIVLEDCVTSCVTDRTFFSLALQPSGYAFDGGRGESAAEFVFIRS